MCTANVCFVTAFDIFTKRHMPAHLHNVPHLILICHCIKKHEIQFGIHQLCLLQTLLLEEMYCGKIYSNILYNVIYNITCTHKSVCEVLKINAVRLKQSV